jgi:hypothetical protein
VEANWVDHHKEAFRLFDAIIGTVDGDDEEKIKSIGGNNNDNAKPFELLKKIWLMLLYKA